MNRENIVETRFGTLRNITVILSVSEESLHGLFNILCRFFTTFRMTTIQLCYFEFASGGEKPKFGEAKFQQTQYTHNTN